MSYTALAVVGVAGALLLDLVVLGTRLVRRRSFWTAYGIVLVFQLLTNGWLTGRGIVSYDGDAILGSGSVTFIGDGRLVYAPVEDLAFGFALVLLTCTAWQRLGEQKGDEPA
jgi:lycopene cyclase domain-containing protein